MRSIDKFTGPWLLESWQYEKDGVITSYPYGKNARGLLIYTLEGMMSAILMKPDRTGDEEGGYTAYGGKYVIRGGKVQHIVGYSNYPEWIGKTLVRSYEFKEFEQRLILTTESEKNSSGQTVRNILSWRKYD